MRSRAQSRAPTYLDESLGIVRGAASRERSSLQCNLHDDFRSHPVRTNSRQADRFGLDLTRDNHAAGTAFIALQRQNLGVPRPGLLYKIFRASHPPIGERVDFINVYRPR